MNAVLATPAPEPSPYATRLHESLEMPQGLTLTVELTHGDRAELYVHAGAWTITAVFGQRTELLIRWDRHYATFRETRDGPGIRIPREVGEKVAEILGLQVPKVEVKS